MIISFTILHYVDLRSPWFAVASDSHYWASSTIAPTAGTTRPSNFTARVKKLKKNICKNLYSIYHFFVKKLSFLKKISEIVKKPMVYPTLFFAIFFWHFIECGDVGREGHGCLLTQVVLVVAISNSI